METPDENCTRIYFQNINGITTSTSLTERWKQLLETMNEKQCSIFGLVETNTNWRHPKIKPIFISHSKQQFKHSSVTYSLNRFQPKTLSRYQPGGCLQVCTNHWISRIIEIISDPRQMGRWTGTKFRLKQKSLVTVITAYRPFIKNSTKNKNTSNTTHRQQVVMLSQDGVIDPDPRAVFLDDLLDLIKIQELDPNNNIILLLDANESLFDTNSKLLNWIQKTTLTDCFSQLSNTPCNIPTHINGSKKIDYIFTSKNLLPHIDITNNESIAKQLNSIDKIVTEIVLASE